MGGLRALADPLANVGAIHALPGQVAVCGAPSRIEPIGGERGADTLPTTDGAIRISVMSENRSLVILDLRLFCRLFRARRPRGHSPAPTAGGDRTGPPQPEDRNSELSARAARAWSRKTPPDHQDRQAHYFVVLHQQHAQAPRSRPQPVRYAANYPDQSNLLPPALRPPRHPALRPPVVANAA